MYASHFIGKCVGAKRTLHLQSAATAAAAAFAVAPTPDIQVTSKGSVFL